jgi:hypothetical protein
LAHSALCAVDALGCQEEWEDSPEGYPQSAPYQWWNYHDAYGKDEWPLTSDLPWKRRAAVLGAAPALFQILRLVTLYR